MLLLQILHVAVLSFQAAFASVNAVLPFLINIDLFHPVTPGGYYGCV